MWNTGLVEVIFRIVATALKKKKKKKKKLCKYVALLLVDFSRSKFSEGNNYSVTMKRNIRVIPGK